MHKWTYEIAKGQNLKHPTH